MTIIASFDVGTSSLAVAIYHAETRRILDWVLGSVALVGESYTSRLQQFDEQHCKHRDIDIVVIEKQLRHVNQQMARLEANLEGYYFSQGKQVEIWECGHKYRLHGLDLPVSISQKFDSWKAQALQRANGDRLSKDQLTRLNKKKAKELTSFFLQISTQAPAIQALFDMAEKQDDLADALLQALSFCHVALEISPHPPQVIEID